MGQNTRQPLGKTQEAALKNIVQGLYYRHEFARRNPAVLSEGTALLDSLQVPPSNGDSSSGPMGTRLWSDKLLPLKSEGSHCRPRAGVRKAFIESNTMKIYDICEKKVHAPAAWSTRN